LSNCFKLKNYDDRVFISPGEAADVRRRRVFDRLKMKAEQNGHSVAAVDNDVLVVNDESRLGMGVLRPINPS